MEVSCAGEKCFSHLQVYKQKVKHLLYEHQNNLAALKIEAEVAVKEAVEGCRQQQQGLVEDKARLKQQLREQVRVLLWLLCVEEGLVRSENSRHAEGKREMMAQQNDMSLPDFLLDFILNT